MSEIKKADYLIIGNGTAAVGAVEGIRSVDKAGTITVISQEPYKAYCRPLISYYLEGKASPERMGYRSESFYEDNECGLLLGKTAGAIDPDSKTVTLESGEVICYEKLLIASGSSPFVPGFEGLESVPKEFSFMTYDDALAIEKAVTKESKVLIIGAGLIGLKCAEGLKERVGKITVCDLAPKVLSSILDDDCAKIVSAHLEANGISLMTGDTAVSFSGSKARMKSGAEVEFDVLVLAVGVRPNIGIFKEAGGSCGRAITVDTKMHTSLCDIYAAGDCTESLDISSGTVKVMALMPNAYMQGRCAGINMAGGGNDFTQAIPMNSIGFFGLHIMSAGSYTGEEVILHSDKGLKKFYIDGGLLKGFIIIGDTQRAGIYTSLIRNKIPLDTIDFESLKQTPQIYSLGKDYCHEKLGGVV